MDPVVLERLTVLAGRSWSAEELSGGVNNAVLRVRTEDDEPGLDLVVRHWPADDGVDHDVEVAALRAAAGAGVAAEVVHHAPDERLLVVGFTPGRPLVAADLLDDAVLGRVVAALHRLHAVAAEVPALELDGRVAVPADVRTVLARDPEPLVLCHNDLVPANLVDDGEHVRLIDFEYAGLAEPSAELAGLAVGAGLDDARVVLLTELYYGAATPARLARVRAWQVVVRRVWSAWARERGHDQWVLDD